ncbi:MAG: hypothetical protein WAP57_03795 [Aquabacterium commune]|uniref:hypothetical protein n=1 Tax=Aquabacterium commune TaxID=70586 RepID=UPI003BAF6428
MTTKQTFPPVTIEALSNGLLRLEDETSIDGSAVIDLHPAQVQTLAILAGFTMPGRGRKALERIASRLGALHERTKELERSLCDAVVEHSIGVAPELTAAEFIAENLGEVLRDVQDLMAPDTESDPEHYNQGGQLLIPM